MHSAILNGSADDFDVFFDILILLSLGIYPAVRVLYHIVVRFLTFLEAAHSVFWNGFFY